MARKPRKQAGSTRRLESRRSLKEAAAPTASSGPTKEAQVPIEARRPPTAPVAELKPFERRAKPITWSTPTPALWDDDRDPWAAWLLIPVGALLVLAVLLGAQLLAEGGGADPPTNTPSPSIVGGHIRDCPLSPSRAQLPEAARPT
jgi:hypothetical protein